MRRYFCQLAKFVTAGSALLPFLRAVVNGDAGVIAVCRLNKLTGTNAKHNERHRDNEEATIEQMGCVVSHER